MVALRNARPVVRVPTTTMVMMGSVTTWWWCYYYSFRCLLRWGVPLTSAHSCPFVGIAAAAAAAVAVLVETCVV